MVDELKPCWTCSGRSYAKVAGSMEPVEYRCINCKAIYPDFALGAVPGFVVMPRDALEPFLKAAMLIQKRRDDYGDRRVAAFGGLADAHDLYPKDFVRLLAASPNLRSQDTSSGEME